MRRSPVRVQRLHDVGHRRTILSLLRPALLAELPFRVRHRRAQAVTVGRARRALTARDAQSRVHAAKLKERRVSNKHLREPFKNQANRRE
jgi:hypothetical protein